jgi:hypothetical protein
MLKGDANKSLIPLIYTNDEKGLQRRKAGWRVGWIHKNFVSYC